MLGGEAGRGDSGLVKILHDGVGGVAQHEDEGRVEHVLGREPRVHDGCDVRSHRRAQCADQRDHGIATGSALAG